MKKKLFILTMLLMTGAVVFAQVAINTDGSSPHNSAMLDVKSSSKGLLPPRMTHAEINAIVNPANGLIVYCTDCGTDGTGAFLGFTGNTWRSLITCLLPFAPTAGVHIPADNQIVWNWNASAGASGYRWGTTSSFSSATDMGSSTTKTESGLVCNVSYTRYVWAYNSCGISVPVTLTQTTTATPPAAPVAGTHVATTTQIIWNWNPVTGATGYKWNTTNNFATAADMGTSTSKTETGLTNNTTYTRYVWSYSLCGNSSSTILTQSTLPGPQPCAGVPTVVYGGKTYNTVQIGPQCWLKENLNIGTRINESLNQTDNGIIEKYCYNDLEANCEVYGGLYQWSETMKYTPSTNLNPSGRQGICPDGWHLPSDAEWCQLTLFLDPATDCNSTTWSGSSGGKMKEPGTTHWNPPNFTSEPCGFNGFGGGSSFGTLGWNNFRDAGSFWSTFQSATDYAWTRDLGSSSLSVYRSDKQKVWGMSVRCIKDSCASYAPVGVSISPSANPACTGAPVIYTAVPVNGGSGPFYQWKVNGGNAGTNNPVFTYTPAGNDVITCVMTSSLACTSGNPATSNAITMTVNPLLPVSATITASANPSCSGQPVTYTAVATNGGSSPSYQWTVNGILSLGAVNPTYSFTPSNNYTVQCQVTSNALCATGNPAFSNVITMTVVNPPASPGAGTHTPALTQIIWRWNPVSGASGYKWSTTNNYSTATEMGTATSRTETSLVCNTAYTRYVWAYSSCGPSAVTTLIQSTLTDPPAAPTAGTHVAGTNSIVWNWNPVTGATGYRWNTTNNYATAINKGTSTSHNETSLAALTTYTRYVWAYSACGVSPVTILTATTLWACGSPITDSRDGQSYGTVLIGTQCWMSENLNIGQRIDLDQNQTNNSIIEKYCYNDLESNCAIYKGLYQWNEMMSYATSSNTIPSGRQGICPNGWHLPSWAEYNQMISLLGGKTLAGGKMKETGYTHWNAPNLGASNSSGFTALPGGVRDPASYLGLNQSGHYYTSTEYSGGFSYRIVMTYSSKELYDLNDYSKNYGCSVRCVQN